MQVQDFEPATGDFLREVLAGLRGEVKTLPCKYFYDEEGSRLFDAICELDEYYPTRTELAIMAGHAPEIARQLGAGCLLIEYGSGSSVKTRLLLDALDKPAGYVPIDISKEHLRRSARSLATAYPGLEVLPVCADYTGDYEVPRPRSHVERRVIYFPGSTIGNFHPDAAVGFLRHVAEVCGDHGGLLIGVDLAKDRSVLERAYNDARGVTAAFNLNLLARINRELGADFDLGAFRHDAVWNARAGRIEMHLVSLGSQTVRLDGEDVCLGAGETIRTECSYKYDLGGFAELAAAAGLRREAVWTDPSRWFSVQLFVVD